MFKRIALLLSLAISSFAAPASVIDISEWEDGITRGVSGGSLGVAFPRSVPAPAGFNITSIGVMGTGCPTGSAYTSLSSDRTSFAIFFSNYYAKDGPGVDIADNRNACQVTLGLKIPGGFTFGLLNVDFYGWYALDSGVTATQEVLYYYQGSIDQATSKNTIKGPVAPNFYTYRDTFDVASIVQSPCGASTVLNIKSALIVNNDGNPQGSGVIATDATSTSLQTIFHLGWSSC